MSWNESSEAIFFAPIEIAYLFVRRRLGPQALAVPVCECLLTAISRLVDVSHSDDGRHLVPQRCPRLRVHRLLARRPVPVSLPDSSPPRTWTGL